ncbi:MAG: bifunctional hydroxymethylpyrimidine kinase/phosphomethylpyrimidine kinase [Pseudomonadota bacterium]
MKRILTIAASDSGGGAGIQADIKTITVLGGFAMSAITALTAQNTRSVEAIHPVPPRFIEQQIDAVLQDIGADAVKTGMLFTADAIQTVSRALQKYGIVLSVIDPVMLSKSGSSLIENAAIKTLTQELFPLAFMVTPNLDEASTLCAMSVDSPQKMKEAALMLYRWGPKHVLIKGGHLAGDCMDLLYDGHDFTELTSSRITTKNTHGTGCTFSAAIATELAKGFNPPEAVRRAKDFITTAIRFSLPLGSGHGPTNPYANIAREAQLFQCSAELENAYKKLLDEKIGRLIPEVQSNFGYAIASAALPEDIVAFPGRIIKFHDTIAKISAPQAGASRHIAKIILTAYKADRSYRAAMNIIWNPDLIEKCRRLGFTVCEFDRRQEPPDVKELEGSTLEWGTQQAISLLGRVPDIIFDRGDAGKEPMTRVLGTGPMDVADKILNIAKEKQA